MVGPLASWKDGDGKRAIVEFVELTVSEVPVEERVAVFDNDGGTINRVAIDVSGEPYVDLEREAVAMMARE